MNTKLRYEIARGALTSIRRGAYNGTLGPLGIGEEEWAVVVRDEPWTRQDRRTVVEVFEAVAFGAMDLLGLPRLELPSEYMAAVIVSMVRPVNYQVACRWIERGVTIGAESMTDGSMEPVRAHTLFVLVLELATEKEAVKAREALEKKINDRLAALDDGVDIDA